MAASGKISKILEELREAQAQRDESELAALGKRSVFKVRLKHSINASGRVRYDRAFAERSANSSLS